MFIYEKICFNVSQCISRIHKWNSKISVIITNAIIHWITVNLEDSWLEQSNQRHGFRIVLYLEICYSLGIFTMQLIVFGLKFHFKRKKNVPFHIMWIHLPNWGLKRTQIGVKIKKSYGNCNNSDFSKTLSGWNLWFTLTPLIIPLSLTSYCPDVVGTNKA